jgi:hypothetical protein
MTSIREQAEAIINHQVFEFVCKLSGKDELELSDYEKYLTITRVELLDYIKERYSIDTLMRTSHSIQDGFYAIQNNGTWNTFRQEREIRFNELKVVSQNEVLERYVSVELGYE